jgi:hypothetical protein
MLASNERAAGGIYMRFEARWSHSDWVRVIEETSDEHGRELTHKGLNVATGGLRLSKSEAGCVRRRMTWTRKLQVVTVTGDQTSWPSQTDLVAPLPHVSTILDYTTHSSTYPGCPRHSSGPPEIPDFGRG